MNDSSLQELLRSGGTRRPFSESGSTISDDDAEYLAFSCGRVGTRSLPMISFIRSDGHQVVLPYVDLHAITSPDPTRGFLLDFGTREVVVEGLNLIRCFRYVCSHRLAELVELPRSQAFAVPAEQPVVHSLLIRRPKPQLQTQT